MPPKGVGGDVTQALLVIHPECILELSLHCLHVWVLHEEGGTQLAELPELYFSGTILIDLLEEVLELLLLRVEQVEADLEALDLIHGQIGGVVDLLEVDVCVGIRLGHVDYENLLSGWCWCES